MARKKTRRVEWIKAPDIEKRVKKLVIDLHIDWIERTNIHSFRSFNSKTRASARIWGLSRIWQQALKEKPSYIVEVISEKFDNLSQKKQDTVLLHELAHIPKTFSGSLVPHFKRGKRKFSNRVKDLIQKNRKISD